MAALPKLASLILESPTVEDADFQRLLKSLPHVRISVGTGAGIKTYGPPFLFVVVRAADPLKQRVEKTLRSLSPKELPYRIVIPEKPLSGLPVKIVDVQPDAQHGHRISVVDAATGVKDEKLTETFQTLLPRLLEQKRGEES